MSYPTSTTLSKPRVWATIVHNSDIVCVKCITQTFKVGSTISVNGINYTILGNTPNYNKSGALESVNINVK